MLFLFRAGRLLSYFRAKLGAYRKSNSFQVAESYLHLVQVVQRSDDDPALYSNNMETSKSSDDKTHHVYSMMACKP